MSKSIIFGGSGGSTFDDFTTKSSIVGIQKIYIRAGNQVDGIQVVYRLANGQTWTSGQHGGGGGTDYSFSVGEGKFISKIEGKTNETLVDQLTFTVTNDNGSTTIHGPYGTTGNTPFSVEGNVIAVCGRADNLLDGVGFYLYAPLNKMLWLHGPGLKISKLYIRSGDQVNGIQAEYVALGGSIVKGPSFGGTEGSSHVMVVGLDEVIEKMEGMTKLELIDQVTFTMRNTKGVRRTAGPYGKTGNTPFSVTALNGIQGLYGRAGDLIDALGVYYN
ncbi:uncharacterized protein LOC135333198 [Halichondria panicea]|uniref:uncharacterized protein LOC135333198 n=1 Tax=Halichondria panicea TaxID=6063 RepID=UPI00312BB4C7